MLARVACSMRWMTLLASKIFHVLDSRRIIVKTSELAPRKTFFAFKIPIHDFHEQNNSFHLYNSIHFNHRPTVDVKIIGVAQQQKPKFSLQSEILTELHNSASKNISFFQNANSPFLMNTIIRSILTLFTSCKHRHQYCIIRYHPNFWTTANFFNFFQIVRYLQMLCTCDRQET